MKFDLCVPVYRNLRCLRVALTGVARYLRDGSDLARLVLHVEDPAEEPAIVEVTRSLGYGAVEPVSRGPNTRGMAGILDDLLSAATADWVVFTEQDAFVCIDLGELVARVAEGGYDVAGPVDTFHYSHPNARGRGLYGQYSRLSPEPGYYHSSLVVLRRAAVADIDRPFTLPADFRLHGYGILGGETYYGLRYHLGGDLPAYAGKGPARSRLAFFDQNHAGYGYGADLRWGGELLATHLYYSSTRAGYAVDGFLSESDRQWLDDEEERFLRDYESNTTTRTS